MRERLDLLLRTGGGLPGLVQGVGQLQRRLFGFRVGGERFMQNLAGAERRARDPGKLPDQPRELFLSRARKPGEPVTSSALCFRAGLLRGTARVLDRGLDLLRARGVALGREPDLVFAGVVAGHARAVKAYNRAAVTKAARSAAPSSPSAAPMLWTSG